jgi:translation initiation factor 1
VIEGLTAKANDLSEVFKKLQSGCGSGGCVKPEEDLMELQGDHREKVKQLLAGIGFRIKERR